MADLVKTNIKSSKGLKKTIIDATVVCPFCKVTVILDALSIQAI